MRAPGARSNLPPARPEHQLAGVYVGDGRIVSNDIGDEVPGEGGVYLVDFGLIESKWGSTYLGWASPIYSTT
ncbi:hypothetical protein GCM10009789_37830 [Kribbella sancticallisti]|uniref:Uncharacterized protein n=1 Tax=Kribbella sancticallisti TaxID=460087 RepID=A0ABN2DMJ2_9ACTN